MHFSPHGTIKERASVSGSVFIYAQSGDFQASSDIGLSRHRTPRYDDTYHFASLDQPKGEAMPHRGLIVPMVQGYKSARLPKRERRHFHGMTRENK